MSAATPSIQAGTSTRQTGFAAFALILAVALLGLVAFGQLVGRQAAPAGVTTQVQHDHGWSSASGSTGSGWYVAPNNAAVDAARHPSRRSVTVTPEGIKVTGSRGGGILYNGIPTAGARGTTGGSGGSTRGLLAR